MKEVMLYVGRKKDGRQRTHCAITRGTKTRRYCPTNKSVDRLERALLDHKPHAIILRSNIALRYCIR